jgi:hypothetical protein
MNEPKPSPMEQARQTFVRLIRHKNEAEKGVLKLLKHPDTTGAQISEVRRMMLALEESLHRVIPVLRAKYPYRGFSDAPRPWHRQEYDRYDEAIMGAPTTDAREGEGNNQTNQESKDGI